MSDTVDLSMCVGLYLQLTKHFVERMLPGKLHLWIQPFHLLLPTTVSTSCHLWAIINYVSLQIIHESAEFLVNCLSFWKLLRNSCFCRWQHTDSFSLGSDKSFWSSFLHSPVIVLQMFWQCHKSTLRSCKGYCLDKL